MKTWSEHRDINIIERLVGENEIAQARAQLLSIDTGKLPNRHLAQFAQVARRAGLPQLSLATLSRMIYELKTATAAEKTEYASSVRRLGLLRESDRILVELPQEGRTLLYRAFGHIQNWNYSEAEEYLRQFLAQPNLIEKDQLIGQLNLIATLINIGNVDTAETLLAEVDDASKEAGGQIGLHCVELKAQLNWYRREYQKCFDILHDSSIQLLAESIGTTALTFQKWRLLSQIAVGKVTSSSDEISSFRRHIRKEKEWETLRHFDWLVAQITKDQMRCQSIYFQTPFQGFKSYALRIGFRPSDSLIMTNGSHTPAFDPILGFIPIGKFGGLEHRVCLALLSDSYQPWNQYRLFDAAYPDERYRPVVSAKKMYTLVGRLRDLILDDKLPLELLATPHGYRLRPEKNSAVKLYPQMNFGIFEELLVYTIRLIFAEATFTEAEFRVQFKLTNRTSLRYLKMLESQSLIVISTRGRQREFRLST